MSAEETAGLGRENSREWLKAVVRERSAAARGLSVLDEIDLLIATEHPDVFEKLGKLS